MPRRQRSTALPLFWRVGRIALLTQDPTLLQLAQLHLGWRTSAYTDAAEFSKSLAAEIPFWEADAWNQQEAVRAWRAGEASLASEVVRYWARNTERYAFTRVALVDQTLAGTSGVEVLRGLRREGWTGLSVLLSAGNDERAAIAAFNEGLIDRYEVKANPLPPLIGGAIADLQGTKDERLDQIWRTTLRPEQDAVLRLPDVARALGTYLRARMSEYIVIGDPFGALGLSVDGQITWVPLRIATAGATHWFDDRDLRSALSLPGPAAERAPAVPFGISGQLVGQCFQLAEQAEPAHPVGYRAWLNIHQNAPRRSYIPPP